MWFDKFSYQKMIKSGKLNYLIYPHFFQPVISLLETKAIGFHGLVMKPLYEMPVGIGLLAKIIAEKMCMDMVSFESKTELIFFLVW